MLERRPQFPDLFDRIGGEEKMRAVLRDFYDRIFTDMLIGFFFAGRDKALLVERQMEFTARHLGVAIAYHGKSMPDAHASLPPILPGHFDRRHRILCDVIAAHDIPVDIAKAWIDYDQSFRRAVVRDEMGERPNKK